MTDSVSRALIRIYYPLHGTDMPQALGIKPDCPSPLTCSLWPYQYFFLPLHPIRACVSTATSGSTSWFSFSMCRRGALSRSSHSVSVAIRCVASPKVKTSPMSPAALSCSRIGNKELGQASRPNAGTDTDHQTGVGRGFRQGEPTKGFVGQISLQVPCQVPIRENVYDLEQRTAEQPLGFIAVCSFKLAYVRQGLGGFRQLDLQPTGGMSGGDSAVMINQFQLGWNS